MLDKIKEKTSIELVRPSVKRNYYHVEIQGDQNDADYVYEDFDIRDIFYDELFILILCYLKTDSRTYRWFGLNGHYDSFVGHHVEEDVIFPWLQPYLYSVADEYDYNLIPYDAHSINSIDITYIDNNGLTNTVQLPRIVDLFKDKDEMIEYINVLFEKYVATHLDSLIDYGFEEEDD